MKLFFVSVFLLFSQLAFSIDKDTSSVKVINLNSNWKFSQSGNDNWYSATVPGCVHTDLLNNKLIPDPFYGTNENSLQWIGKTDWDYQSSFDVPPDLYSKNNIELDFNGLDTYADVYLNDSLILSADNMFRTWIVSCKNLLKEKNNILRIHFRNVFEVNMPKMEKAPFKLLDFPNNDQSDTMLAMYSRKAQFHYGWDWGPRFVTCGIWRNIILKGWDGFKIDNVQVNQKNVSAKNAGIISSINITSDKDQKISVNVAVDGKQYAMENFQLKKGENKIPVNFAIESPNLWWTNGLGNHHLYNFNFTVASENGSRDSKNVKIGIRSLKIVREKDSMGRSFYVKLNGVPVFMKGANYIPQDNFQNRVTPERYEHMIKSAAEAHMNILRVWGGGIYENNEFYNLCDENGILVWQEFMFACAMYPADSAFLNNVKQEVVDNVTRLRNHPSLALYCGNNENVVGWYQWGWKQSFHPDVQSDYEKNMQQLYQEIIPEAIKEVDTTRYYHYTSPSAGFNNFSNADGDIHYWGVWHGKEPFEDFNKNIARFVSEYGFQSYPEISTIKKYAAPEDMQLHSGVMLSHQRCMADNRKDKEYSNRLIQLYMDRQFREPKNFAMYVYVSQVLQAEGDKIAIEAHRRNMPFCMGSMYWQIDDCWPVASWSSIDYYGNWKALHYYVKREYKTFLISTQMKDDSLNFFVVSDSLTNVNADLVVKLVDFNGKISFQKSFPVEIKANSSFDYVRLDKNEFENLDESKMVLTAELNSEGKVLAKNSFFFKEPKDLDLEKPNIKITTFRNSDGYGLKLTTNKYAKDVYLSFNNEKGFFTDNYFDLFPGEDKVIELKTANEIKDIDQKIKIISLVDSY